MLCAMNESDSLAAVMTITATFGLSISHLFVYSDYGRNLKCHRGSLLYNSIMVNDCEQTYIAE